METEKKEPEDNNISDETKKSLATGEKVIALNKKLADQEGRDGDEEEKKDREKWTTEG